MDKLEAMQVYVCVVDTHSFIRAAEVLGVPRSTVSRVVKELESWLKIQLLQRTTRKLSVTAEGRRYYEECKRVLADVARRNFSHRNALNYAPQQESEKQLLRTVQIKTPRCLSHSNDEAGNLR